MPTPEQKRQALEILRAGGDSAKRDALSVLRGEGGIVDEPPAVKQKEIEPQFINQPDSALELPGLLSKVIIDSLLSGKSRNDLVKAYNDKSELPGEPTVERLFSSPVSQTVAKTVLDLGADPLSYVPVGEVTKPVMSAGAKMVDAIGGKMASILGPIAETLTNQGITRKGMTHAFEDFSPVEQMFSKATNKEIQSSYGPKKQAFLELMAGKIPEGEIPKFIPVDSAPLTQVREGLETSLSQLERQRLNPGPAGELLYRIDDILTRPGASGMTTAPELKDLLDHINNAIEYTPLDNPKSVQKVLKPALQQARDSITGLLKQSAPDFADEMAKSHAAMSMTKGRLGGGMTAMMRNAPAAVGLGAAAYEFSKGDTPGAGALALLTLASRSPAAWNAVVGAGRIPGDILKQGLEKTAQWVTENPTASQAIYEALLHNQKADFQGSMDAFKGYPLPTPQPLPPPAPIDPGNDTSNTAAPTPEQMPNQIPMATPAQEPPPIDPHDADLMQQTGLQSISGGVIQDPAEVERFAENVFHIGALSLREKMRVIATARSTGKIVLPENIQ